MCICANLSDFFRALLFLVILSRRTKKNVIQKFVCNERTNEQFRECVSVTDINFGLRENFEKEKKYREDRN